MLVARVIVQFEQNGAVIVHETREESIVDSSVHNDLDRESVESGIVVQRLAGDAGVRAADTHATLCRAWKERIKEQNKLQQSAQEAAQRVVREATEDDDEDTGLDGA